MTSFPDVAQSADVPSSSLPVVALVVLGSDPSEVAGALTAAGTQGAATAFVVGGGAATRRAAEEHGATWVASISAMSAALADVVTHVWFLHSDCRPRPGALAALTSESHRVDASVAGSKVLRSDDHALLESVGGATDVFGHPYSGLSDGEVDQEQYDVVRDVAFIPAVSVLIRRDLFKGLGGPDILMAPGAQGVDLAQRARLLGGRVVVVPSSEVFHSGSCSSEAPAWRERAGEFRAIAKAYRPLTAVWVIPFSIVIGLIAGLARLLIGRPGFIAGEIKAWLWNIKNLRSTLSGRRVTGQSRRVGDEELFRYQISGSVLLRQVGEEVTEWLRKRSSPDGALGALLESRRGFWHEPSFVASGIAVALALVATRVIWTGGMPVVGFSLPPDDQWVSVLGNYAGGWNPSGLGWTEPLRPAVAVVTFFAGVGLSPAWMTFLAMIAGFLGTMRLLRTLGASERSRIVGAFVGGFGPALFAISETGYWPGFLAAGLAPWAIDAASRPWQGSLRFRIGRVGAAIFVTGLMAALVPWLALLPLAATLLYLLVGTDGRWQAAAQAAVLGAAGLVWTIPWLTQVVPAKLLTSGQAITWPVPAWLGLGFTALLAIAMPLVNRHDLGLIAVGALMAYAGAFVSTTAALPVGLEGSAAAMVTTATGVAIAVGGIVATIAGPATADRFRRMLSLLVTVGMVGLIAAASVLPILRGRAGFEADRFRNALAFTGPRAEAQGPDRVLFLGRGAPGELRTLTGVPYRVKSAEVPFTEAWLPVRQAGDVALERALLALRDPQVQRPGATLAEFGIRWVVVLEPNPLEAGFQAKLDMRRLPLFDVPFVVYENLESSPRAVRDDGVIWRHDGFRYQGPASTAAQVRVAEQYNERWRPDAAPDDWAVLASANTGEVAIAVDGSQRALAWVAAGVAAASLLAALAGIGARRR